MRLFRMCVWLIVLNLGVCNQIWSEPVDYYWWIIEIVIVIISYLMADENKK